MFSMREDGFEFDRFLLTKEPGAMESKNSEPGPAASPLGSTAASFERLHCLLFMFFMALVAIFDRVSSNSSEKIR